MVVEQIFRAFSVTLVETSEREKTEKVVFKPVFIITEFIGREIFTAFPFIPGIFRKTRGLSK